MYLTAPTGTVHLTDRWPALRTLCGQVVGGAAWALGDETTSGIAATCRRCPRLRSDAGMPASPEAPEADSAIDYDQVARRVKARLREGRHNPPSHDQLVRIVHILEHEGWRPPGCGPA